MDIKQNSSYAPVNSGPAPSDLPGLQSWKATRSSSSIIADKVATLRDRLADPSTPPAAIPGLEAAIRRVEKQRDPAAQALAASRMAAKVAVDKLEARLADAAASHSKYYLEINDESFKLEHRDHVIINNKAVATEDAGIRAFNVFAWLAAVERLPGAVARGSTSTPPILAGSVTMQPLATGSPTKNISARCAKATSPMLPLRWFTSSLSVCAAFTAWAYPARSRPSAGAALSSPATLRIGASMKRPAHSSTTPATRAAPSR